MPATWTSSSKRSSWVKTSFQVNALLRSRASSAWDEQLEALVPLRVQRRCLRTSTPKSRHVTRCESPSTLRAGRPIDRRTGIGTGAHSGLQGPQRGADAARQRRASTRDASEYVTKCTGDPILFGTSAFSPARAMRLSVGFSTHERRSQLVRALKGTEESTSRSSCGQQDESSHVCARRARKRRTSYS